MPYLTDDMRMVTNVTSVSAGGNSDIIFIGYTGINFIQIESFYICNDNLQSDGLFDISMHDPFGNLVGVLYKNAEIPPETTTLLFSKENIAILTDQSGSPFSIKVSVATGSATLRVITSLVIGYA